EQNDTSVSLGSSFQSKLWFRNCEGTLSKKTVNKLMTRAFRSRLHASFQNLVAQFVKLRTGVSCELKLPICATASSQRGNIHPINETESIILALAPQLVTKSQQITF